MEHWFGYIGDNYDFVAKAQILNEWALAGWRFSGHAEHDGSGMNYLMTRELRVE